MQKMKDGRVVFTAAEVAAMRSVLDSGINVVENMNVAENRGNNSPEEHLLVALQSCVSLGVTVEALVSTTTTPGEST